MLFYFACEAAGAASARHSLRPLFSEGRIYWQASDASCRENAKLYPHHCAERWNKSSEPNFDEISSASHKLEHLESGTSNLPTGWFSINHDGETPMTKLKLMAAAAVLSAAIAGPAMAGDGYHRGPVGAAADTAAGVAGAAVGTAAAVATAPFGNSYAYDNSHDYYANQRDYGPDGYACHPGTWIKGADGQRHVCQ
jgi:hypothetical protein